eukprot:512214_1
MINNQYSITVNNSGWPQQQEMVGQQSIPSQSIPSSMPSAPKVEINSAQTESVNLQREVTIIDCNEDDDNSPDYDRSDTIEMEGSIFKDNEFKFAILWLLYTFAYWTLLTWIPILVRFSFNGNLWSFIIWCLGFVGMISTANTVYNGYYPSGSTKANKFEMFGVGRWTASLLTSAVIIDCFVLVYISVELDNITSTDRIIYNTNLSRLVFHIIHIFWSSLFFYNRFYQNHKQMAIRAFILEWGDIVWSCIVSFIITAPQPVDVMYFLMVGIELIGWMAPMMFNKKWGTKRYADKVSVHLLVLDLCTDAPVIFTLLVTQAYKDNTILWLDLMWKSYLLERSISVYLGKFFLRQMAKRNGDEEETFIEGAEMYGISFDAITFVWVIFVALYWNICVLARCILDNEIALNYEYYTLLLGMIGIFCIADACFAGYSADTAYGRPFIAFTCLIISTDCVAHAYELLSGLDDKEDVVGETMMICHCIALLSSIVFYSTSFKKGVGYSLGVQWIDVILMFIVIEILNTSYIGNCFSKALCSGYFVVFTIKIIFWFTPMIFGYVDDDKRIHLHMVLLDTFTDLPLVLIIIFSHGYNVHPFVFVDIVFKVIVLLISYSYHLMINLILKRMVDED